MICRLTLSIAVVFVMSVPARAESGYDVAGMSEDLALYTMLGAYCGLNQHAHIDKIGTLLMAMDAAAFKAGALKAAIVFKGLEKRSSKGAVCAGAMLKRKRLETEFDAIGAVLDQLPN